MENPKTIDNTENTMTEEQKRLSKIPTDRDWFLSQFVTNADKYGLQTGVVLNVGGTIISGTIVSGADYFIGFADEYASALKDIDNVEAVRASYANYAKVHPKAEFDENDNEIEDNRNTHPIYIHLKNARFFLNGQPSIPGNKGVWWRGRISSVDGFSLGLLNHD